MRYAFSLFTRAEQSEHPHIDLFTWNANYLCVPCAVFYELLEAFRDEYIRISVFQNEDVTYIRNIHKYVLL